MKKLAFAIILSLGATGSALAEDWSGTPLTAGGGERNQYTVRSLAECITASGVFVGPAPLACTDETSLVNGVDFPGVTKISAVPIGVSSAYSSVQIQARGLFQDQSNPMNVIAVDMSLPLSAFARSDSLAVLNSSVSGLNGSVTVLQNAVSSLQAQVGGFPSAADIALVQTQVTSQGAAIGTLQSAVSAQGASLMSLQSMAAAQGSAISSIQSGLTNLQSTVGTQGSAIAGLQTNVSALNSTVSTLQSRLNSIDTSLSALDQRMAALETLPTALMELGGRIDDARQSANEGTAMAAAMTSMAPAEGKSNRLGINSAIYNDTTAVALNYTRVAGDIDLNVGVAVAGGSTMAKAGVGFSW